MSLETLTPHMDLMREEAVLVQAWKKASSFIRYHNWYSDTLALDRATVNLPRFLRSLQEELQDPADWTSDPLRIVPAPKSQRWQVRAGAWQPLDTAKTGSRLRPLAHVSLRDQVVATAAMLCLADRVETLQGDPRAPVESQTALKHVVSYGNRLFCDNEDGRLRHRWGSGKLYRSYYQDYRSFLRRPEVVAESVSKRDGRTLVVQADLRQFYDRVSPRLLEQKLRTLRALSDDDQFYGLCAHLLNWRWSPKDELEVSGYARQAGLQDFSRVALPQGLVAAGFFANVVLLDFDRLVREFQGRDICEGVVLEDVCRYVDDLRLVVRARSGASLSEIEGHVVQWIQSLLNAHAPGLELADEKTTVAEFRGEERPLVRQSGKMERIQGAISGGFDISRGEEILHAVHGLIRSQQRYAESRTEHSDWKLAPVPDVRDSTVDRFAAARYRSTYRSLRPLLPDVETDSGRERGEDLFKRAGLSTTQRTLDEDAQAFALGLIESWTEDPSNVRLLRIGLDLWPAPEVLTNVLDLLRPFTESGGRRKAPRRVAWYCLAEIFRAAATETGHVESPEQLPAGVDIAAYRAVLLDEAARLLNLPAPSLPWYLKQQILLYIAVVGPATGSVLRAGSSAETRHYREMILFLRGEGHRLSSTDFATSAVLARRSFLNSGVSPQRQLERLTGRQLEQIAVRDPTFAIELLAKSPALGAQIAPRLRDDLCVDRSIRQTEFRSLANLVLDESPDGPLRNELGLLSFALHFLSARRALDECPEVIAPGDVLVRLRERTTVGSDILELRIVRSRASAEGSLYRPPVWSTAGDRWRFQLGYLLRFILTRQPDFTQSVRSTNWRESAAVYRSPGNHWMQRIYGLYSGQDSFGDDWLPITDWMEHLLAALVRWPGSRVAEKFRNATEAEDRVVALIEERIASLVARQVSGFGPLILPYKAPWPVPEASGRPLRNV